ncbi:Predicted phosphodiesterase [Butyrivibrio sp. INlla18]|uniref:metallophosphoesterase family protein n=1 Tax=Butyrivibrio sp. INlla18 TaxID=1520806 RepID=UPI0008831525|nr:metallophosphoesterase family protein [Butyrivibrio sp. INlla18]SDA79121.1 Predicted phosphodiesterase [Butyrivibrio sp. INlla18]
MKLTTERFAVISDVHGNYQALRKALKIIRREKIDQIVFLGDAIGYGADPERCFNLLKKRCSLFLMGNHEAMIIAPEQRKSRLCEESFSWTRNSISGDMISQIALLPMKHTENGMGFYHACPQADLQSWKYLNDPKDVTDAFDGYENICFYGHTHRPRVMIISDDGSVEDHIVKHTSEYVIDTEKERVFVNPGSIGQQRDDITDMSFAICQYDGRKLQLRIERHKYNSLRAYLRIRFIGCGRENAKYLIREKWRKRIYEGIGNRLEWLYR